MKFYISSSCSAQGDVSDIVRELAGLGFRRIELTGNVKYCPELAERILHLKSFHEVDIIIHNYLPFQPMDFVLNLASTEEAIQAKTLDVIGKSIELSRNLKNDLYSLHPGFIHDLGPELDNNFFIKTSEKLNDKGIFYRTVAEIASPLALENFRIAVENLAPQSKADVYSFLCAPEDIYGFLDYFESVPNVGLLLDLGHLNVAAHLLHFDISEMLDNILCKYPHKIFAVHISENDGSRDFHQINAPDSWQVELLNDNRDLLKNANVVFEWQKNATQDAFVTFEAIQKKLMLN